MKIIFYDGVCGLCNHSINYLIQQPSLSEHFFASLQGETAKLYLPTSQLVQLKEMVYWRDGDVFTGAAAVTEIAIEVSKKYRFLRWIPYFIKNFVYRLVAYFRYRIWGKLDSCKLPDPSEVARFLPAFLFFIF